MKKIAIYGAGGLGREVACLINIINDVSPKWDIIGFFDDGISKGTSNEYGSVLGGIDVLNSWNEKLSVIIAIGSPVHVKGVFSKINNTNIDFPNIIAPGLVYLDKKNIKIGMGNIIGVGSLLSCNVVVGDFNLFNGFVSVGHDTIIGSYNTIMTATRISGDVVIGNNNFFGVSSVVLQQAKIGNQTVIGSNSVILKKTKDGVTYYGNPAKIVYY